MATPLYKIPSTPVYAICSDFVVLLILDTFFRFYILHRLNSIPSVSSTQSGSGKRVKSGLSWSHRPVPFSLQSRIPTFRHLCPQYRFFFPIPHPVSRFRRILLLKYWSHPLFRSQEIWLFHESRTIFRSIPNPESSLPASLCYILFISVSSNFPSPDPPTQPLLYRHYTAWIPYLRIKFY